jgi:glyoxylase-like metal-dependent hydrolase (beta-lactamase superfamily II)
MSVERRKFPGGVIGYRMRSGLDYLDVWVYRVGRTLIDASAPGMAGRHLPAVLADGPIDHVFVTHHHEDHSGGADQVRRLTGAQIVTSSFAAPLLSGGFPVRPYQRLMFGAFGAYRPDAVLDVPARGRLPWATADAAFEVLHAPGHSHDMTVLWWPREGILFSADLFLGRRLRGMRGDENFPELHGSLRRVVDSLPVRHVLCTHNPVIDAGAEALAAKLAWMDDTAGAIAERAAAGASVSTIARALFGPRDWRTLAFTFGDLAPEHLVRSALGAVRPRRSVARRVGRDLAAYRYEDGRR